MTITDKIKNAIEKGEELIEEGVEKVKVANEDPGRPRVYEG